MRSAREIQFRLAQKAGNALLYLSRPTLPSRFSIAELPLPNASGVADALLGTDYAIELERIADGIVQHALPLFGGCVQAGPTIEWRKDYVNGHVTGTPYFYFVKYLDFNKSGDHKNIWELNRHQHLILLAQAWLLTGKREYISELESQLASWFEQNPFLKGINFTSALEVAFRALSWLWIDHLVGSDLRGEARQQLRNGMFQHGHFLKNNLSTYFAPNTHLLGEGVALFALGLKFPRTGWETLGREILAEQLNNQVQEDGSHFEQSTYYHVYALDFFLFYYLLDGQPSGLTEPLVKMARFLAAINGPAGLLNFLGDDDGGRLFHPYGERAEFGRATLSTCARIFPDKPFPFYPGTQAEQADWWLGPAPSPIPPACPDDHALAFENSGLVSISKGDLHLLIDAGPFGKGGAGHSHSDTLSFTARLGACELLIDPGTFTYMADQRARDDFRGSAYHSTLRIDRQDQAEPTRPFRWDNKPDVTLTKFCAQADDAYVDASCRNRGVVHRRRFFLLGNRALFVLDNLTGPDGEHSVEQFWHLGAEAESCMTMLSTAPVEAENTSGWRSRCLGSREQSPVLAYRWKTTFPASTATVLLFDRSAPHGQLIADETPEGVTLRVSGFPAIRFPEAGVAHSVKA